MGSAAMEEVSARSSILKSSDHHAPGIEIALGAELVGLLLRQQSIHDWTIEPAGSFSFAARQAYS